MPRSVRSILGTSTIAGVLFVAASLSAPSQTTLFHEDFAGASLSPAVWQVFLNNGAATVGGGVLALTCPSGTFPYIRTLPGLLSFPSDIWTIEVRMAYTVPGGCGTGFAARQNPITNLAVPCGLGVPWLAEDIVHTFGNSSDGIELRAGPAAVNLGAAPSGFHVFRWVSDGTTIVASRDGTVLLTGSHAGPRPENLWFGDPCPANCPNWEYLSIDYVTVTAQPSFALATPPSSPVGTPLVWALSTSPAVPFGAYLFDVSLDGDTPGLAVPAPLPGPIPLNPTFLHLTYGLAFPQLFSGFIGLLDATGQASPVLFTPLYAGIVGQDLYAACITFDPLGPLGIGLISNGARTTFVSPAPTVAGIVPATGSSNGGDPVTISGALFLDGATVTLGGAPATNVQVASPSTITCLTPPRPGGPADVVVSNPGGVPGILAGGFTYYFASPAPTIGGVNPSDGPIAGNSPVLVTGTGFATGASVTIGGASCTNVLVLNPTSIVCQTPAGTLGPRDVVVTNPDTQAGTLTNGFTYLPDLSLSSVSPLVAAIGAPITLQGAGFQSGFQLNVGPVIVMPTTSSSSQIVFPMPAGAACSTQVTVSNPSTQSAALGFNPSPFISSAPGAVGPASGGGTFFLIGSNFFPGTTLSVGGTAATIQSMTQTAIVAVAPAGTVGNAQIVVTSVSGCTATSTYLYQ